METKQWIVSLVLLLSLNTGAGAGQLPPQAAIATSHPLATQAGMAILQQGGNAFDAAVTVAAVLAVVEPYHSGLGGGGFWLLHDVRDPQDSQDIIIDARERAPGNASEKMFLSKDGKVLATLAQEGALAAAIPGEVAGLVYLAHNYGSLPLATLLNPAITLAENGFKVDAHFAKMVENNQKKLIQFTSSKEIFYPNGKALVKDQLFKQPALATSLKTIANQGHQGFYEGKIAEKLVNGVKQQGGIWTLADLKNYAVELHEPLRGKYHHTHITTVGLPSAGGLGLIEALHILSEYKFEPLSEADQKHLIAESLRRVYCDRAKYLGDPDFITVDVNQLLSEDHAQDLRASIKMEHATKSEDLQCGIPIKAGGQTTHYSILDQQGNGVAATLTINLPFGSGFLVPDTGVLLNSEMDDFALKIGFLNAYGLMGHQANLIAPNKRPLSSMTPMMIENNHGIGILGTSGGSKIPSMLLLAALNANKEASPHAWVAASRFHQQLWPDVLSFEPGVFSHSLQNSLRLRGHVLQEESHPYGDMQVVFWDKKANKVIAVSDPRGQGMALVETIRVMKERKVAK